MEYRVLGPLEVCDGATQVALGGRRQRALLARLLLEPGRTVAVERLLDDLWGESVPDSAVKMVHIYVSQLRKLLPGGVLLTRPPGYALEVDPEAIDRVRFERLRGEGRAALAAGDAPAAAARLREALALWRGAALAEFSEPFAEVEAAHLQELHLACLEDRIEADLALGRHADVVGELEGLVTRMPLRERLRGQLMLALYRSGRHAEALDTYRRFRRTLNEELGLEPPTRLRELEQAILEQDPALTADAAPASAAPVAAPPRPVGRDGELERLRVALAAGRHAFVTGEPGAGKTTLVEAFLAERRERTLVGRGQCVEHRGPGEPYLPVLDALGRLAAGPDGPRVVAVLADRAPSWLVQMPWLVGGETLERLHVRTRGTTRVRMLREMVEALAVLAPLVLVLEDLHWSDDSTLDLLAALLRRRDAGGPLVLGTFRPGGEERVGAVVDDACIHGLAEEVPLPRLGREAIADYLAARLGEVPAELPGALHERTGGNPLFMRVLVDHWVAEGDVTGVPHTLRASVERRLAALDHDDAEVLRAASVAGERCDPPTVAAALGRPAEAVEASCRSLVARGVLVEGYGFVHQLHRDVLYERLPADRRAELHRRVGEHLEAGGDASPAELAVHFVRGRDPARAVHALRAAAEQAFSRTAHREGIEHLRGALAAAAELERGPERAHAELEVLGLLGQALVATDGWSAPEAEEALLSAATIARESGDNEPLVSVLLALATLYEVRGEYERAREMVEESVRLAPDASPQRRLETHELLACSFFHQGSFTRALRHAELGAALLDAGEGHYSTFPATLGDNAGVACHDWAGLALWFLGRPGEALERGRTALALAEEPGRSYSLATARAQMAVIHQCRGEVAETLSWAEATIELASERGYAYRVAMGRILRGWALAARGDVDEGLDQLLDGLDASRATGAHMDDAYYLGLLADAHLRAGRVEPGLEAVGEALALAGREPSLFYEPELHRLRGALLRLRGDAEAEASLRRAVALARELGSPALQARAEATLERPAEVREPVQRRRLSVVAWELADVGELAERLEPEELPAAIGACLEAGREAVERHGGHVAHVSEAGAVAYFGYPHAHDDDLERAVRAALEVVSAVAAARCGPADVVAAARPGPGDVVAAARPGPTDVVAAARAGVHNGFAVVGGDVPLALGETPLVAARLAAAARPGSVVVGASTRRLLRGRFEWRDLGDRSLAGVAGPVQAFEVAGAAREPGAELAAAPFAGREHELALLGERWRSAVDGSGQVVVLSGEPGIGKSRLAAELAGRVGDHARLTFRCSPDLAGSALHPVLAQAGAPVPAADATPADRARQLDGLAAWILSEADRRPLLLLVEDLHWADPSTLELLERVVRQAPGARILLLVTTRPDRQLPWPAATKLTLDRLSAPEVEAMVSGLLGGHPYPRELAREVEARTDGVPLFVEELLKALLESGLVAAAEGGFVLSGPLPELTIPATLQDSLTARLDRLGPSKEVAQVAAVLGREFSRELLAAVAPHGPAALRDGLARLVDAELLRQRGRRYRFRHALIRDAAYDSLLPSARRRWHARAAQALEEMDAEPELVARQHAAAGQVEAAIGHWLRAGDRARRAAAYGEAVEHLESGLELVGAGERPELELALQLGLGAARMAARGWGAPETEAAFARAEELSGAAEDSSRLAPALFGLTAFHCSRADPGRAHRIAERMLRIADDPDIRIEAHQLLGVTSFMLGEPAAALEQLDAALGQSDPDRHRAHTWEYGQEPGVAALAIRALALGWLGRADEALAAAEQGVAAGREAAHPPTLGYALGAAGILAQVLADVERAERAAAELLDLARERGLPTWLAWGQVLRGWTVAERGAPEEGLAEAAAGMGAARSVGFVAMRPHFLAMLAVHARGGEGLDMVNDGLRLVEAGGERAAEAELHRARGLLLRGDPAGEAALLLAISVAREQGAVLLERRAVIALEGVGAPANGSL